MLIGRIGVTFVHNFVLRNYDFRWEWSATQKNSGRSKKIQGQTALKNGGGSLAVGSYLQRGSAPPGDWVWRFAPAWAWGGGPVVKNMYQVARGGEWCHIIVSVGGAG